MSNIITTTGRSAATIAVEIRSLDEQARRMTLFYIVEIGQRLIEAKALVPTGEWGTYIKEELNYSHSQVNNFMQISREYGVNGVLSNSQTFGNLPYSKALALLALPPEEREEFVNEVDVESTSVRQLKAAIKERDEARKAQADAEAKAEVADAERRRAELALLDAQKKAAAAKSSESAWQVEIDKLNAALNKATAAEEKAKQQVKKLKANPEIPADLKEKLIAEARAQAVSEASDQLKAQLEEAKAQAGAAAQAREAAEQEVAQLRDDLTAARKAVKLADPDVAAINILASQLSDTFNKIHGHLKLLEKNDPLLVQKFKQTFANFGRDVQERMS